MRLLLDTHVLVWAVSERGRLSPAAAEALEREGAGLYLSAASVWELAIKIRLKKLEMPLPLSAALEAMRESGLKILDISAQHALAVQSLEDHHRDPFDRMLASQALCEDMTLVSADKMFKKYSIKTLW